MLVRYIIMKKEIKKKNYVLLNMRTNLALNDPLNKAFYRFNRLPAKAKQCLDYDLFDENMIQQ